MTRRSIFVEIEIDAALERVWALTQDVVQHGRWDLRFSSIEPAGVSEAGATQFTYTRSVPFHTVRGVGVSLGERSRHDGGRTSALRFWTADPLSPIRGGRGYWRYFPVGECRTRFTTGYDYTPGWGRFWTFWRAHCWAGRRRGVSTVSASGSSGAKHPRNGRCAACCGSGTRAVRGRPAAAVRR